MPDRVPPAVNLFFQFYSPVNIPEESPGEMGFERSDKIFRRSGNNISHSVYKRN